MLELEVLSQDVKIMGRLKLTRKNWTPRMDCYCCL